MNFSQKKIRKSIAKLAPYFLLVLLGGCDVMFTAITGGFGYKEVDGVVYYISGNENDGIIKTPMPYADIETFEELQSAYGYYAKDKNNVYHHTSIIENADPESFKVIDKEDYYFRDKSSIFIKCYYGIEQVEGADPNTLTILTSSWFKDSKFVFWASHKKFQVDDISTFAMFPEGDGYWQYDSMSIYYNGIKIPEIDQPSFKIIDDSRAKDKNNFYYGDLVQPIDNDTFRVFDRAHAIDKNGLYISLGLDSSIVVLSDFDHDKFEMINVREGCTSDFVYRFDSNEDDSTKNHNPIIVTKKAMTDEVKKELIQSHKYNKFNIKTCIPDFS